MAAHVTYVAFETPITNESGLSKFIEASGEPAHALEKSVVFCGDILPEKSNNKKEPKYSFKKSVYLLFNMIR